MFSQQKAKGEEWVVVSMLMIVFALLCIPINLNYFIPFAPLGIIVAMAMGYDAIVGISIIMLGGTVGFSCDAMNLPNTGTAQAIAEPPLRHGIPPVLHDPLCCCYDHLCASLCSENQGRPDQEPYIRYYTGFWNLCPGKYSHI